MKTDKTKTTKNMSTNMRMAIQNKMNEQQMGMDILLRKNNMVRFGRTEANNSE